MLMPALHASRTSAIANVSLICLWHFETRYLVMIDYKCHLPKSMDFDKLKKRNHYLSLSFRFLQANHFFLSC